MPISNPVFNKIVDTVKPVVSVGVGSAICSVCVTLKLNPEALTPKDIPAVKGALVKHYERFWAHKMVELNKALVAL
jgi:hypothetical protein